MHNRTYTLSIDGQERTYIVHVPPRVDRDEPLPVVVVFHGGGGKARVMMWDTGWAAKANAEGFLTVFPEGTCPDPNKPARFAGNPRTWNDGSNRVNVGATQRGEKDVEFVDAMLDDVIEQFDVDRRRIYVTGFSNGAAMAFRAARQLSARIAAAAPVSGSDWMSDTKPARAVPLLYITGTADLLNPVQGGEIFIGRLSMGIKPVVEPMIANWIDLHDCPAEPREAYDKDDIKFASYGDGNGPDMVELYLLKGHGHHWPGSTSDLLPETIVGPNTTKLKATDVIWDFFARHSLPDSAVTGN